MRTLPNLKLSGVDYLCLKMQSNPGQSKRYYLRQKNIYQNGIDPSNGGSGMTGYFQPGCFYDENLWCDYSYHSYKRRDWRGQSKIVSKSCEMHLTRKGWNRANKARQKLGLEPLPYNND